MMIEAVANPGIVRFTVNGIPTEVTANGGRRLLDLLRENLGLTGTKEGCGEGECGACSVLLDGRLVNSCLVPACQVDGHEVRTVEGMADEGHLDVLQSAFLATGAAQCGFCTPGMLAAGRAFLDSGAPPTEAAIREAIAGNLCRCTGYTKIIEAIELAAVSPSGDGKQRLPETAPVPLAVGEGRPSAGPGAALPGSWTVATSHRRYSEIPSVSPGSLQTALQLLGDHRYQPVAGGTDLMVMLATGAGDTGRPLLDLSNLDELRGIRLETPAGAVGQPSSSALALGALTTFAEIGRSPVVAEHLPALAEVAATIGAAQIQNRATLGGNIANASPAGDALPVLLATDAVIVLGGAGGERRCPASAFFTGYRATARSPEELILRIEIPLTTGRRVRFRKVGTRRALAISKVVMAVSWHEDEPETRGRPGAAADLPGWRDVRVAIGSVAPVPMRAPATEGILEGAAPTRQTADRAAAAIAAEIVPIDDVRSTASYRRAVTARILRRIVRDAGDW
jgi:xanthine dehydrogenase iron-sulfur cluster and FAD-binding subunit A